MYDAEAVEAIKNLKASYYRCMDTKQWEGWNDVFAVDATLDTREEAPDLDIVVGRDNIIAFVSNVLEGVTTCHHGHMPEIELTSDSTATGIWALNDIVIFPNGMRLDGYGHYHETYVKADGEWWIASSKLTRLHTDFAMPEES